MLETILQCPDCAGRPNTENLCNQCGFDFNAANGYFNLLPTRLEASKQHEDRVFATGARDYEQYAKQPWRKLIGRLEIERFDREIAPILKPGVFLELAGESCWAANLYKAHYPDSFVIASDVSPNAIQHVAMPLGGMFTPPVDIFAAIDAEHLPLQDDSVDCIFIEAALHHLPNPVHALREIKRVLRVGGRFVAVDHSVPAHFRFLFQATADQRATEFGIQEDLVSFSRWQQYFAEAGWPLTCLNVYDNPAYQRNPIFGLAGKIIQHLPRRLKQSFFPVGLFVIYDHV